MSKIKASDLTRHPPRSPRVRLGGYAILPRILDKCRATLVKKNGEYSFNCPLDQYFLKFAGINPTALRSQLARGLGDGEILAWIQKNQKHHRSGQEIEAWSDFMNRRAPTSIDQRERMNTYQKTANADRDDITTWFDVLDLDDFASFGGPA
ncbi:MAG: DUF5069 domain-containing protein [Verrucomicrobia bacterium]|nr:DUF5069 domain-containing protein [Verrucomicrobiota bacterium]